MDKDVAEASELPPNTEMLNTSTLHDFFVLSVISLSNFEPRLHFFRGFGVNCIAEMFNGSEGKSEDFSRVEHRDFVRFGVLRFLTFYVRGMITNGLTNLKK